MCSGSAQMCDSLSFPATPFGRGLVHVFLEEAIEVPYQDIAKDLRNHADLCGRKEAKQPLRESQTGLNLKLRQGPSVLSSENALQRSYLYPEFSCDPREPQLNIAVRSKDEVMCKRRRILE